MPSVGISQQRPKPNKSPDGTSLRLNAFHLGIQASEFEVRVQPMETDVPQSSPGFPVTVVVGPQGL